MAMICNEELSLFDLNNNVTVAFLETLVLVSNAYGSVHKYICLFICVFGCLANLIHIFVLTRPVMHRCAVNRLLSIIAVCDIATMVSYLIFIIRFGFAVDSADPPPGYSLGWIAFLLSHVVCSIALHAITLYLTVATAYIRYKTLKKLRSKWNHQNTACFITLPVTVLVFFLSVPTFLIHSVVNATKQNGRPIDALERLYTVGLTQFSFIDTCFVFKFNLWLTGIMFKVIPCILLIVFTIALLWELELNSRRRRMITSGNSQASRRSVAQKDRTTKVLITLLIIFLATEFPQGILAILNGLFPNDIHQIVYVSLGEILDLLSLINCNTCFIVYPILSTQYRRTLRYLIGRLFCSKEGTTPAPESRKYHSSLNINGGSLYLPGHHLVGTSSYLTPSPYQDSTRTNSNSFQFEVRKGAKTLSPLLLTPNGVEIDMRGLARTRSNSPMMRYSPETDVFL